MKTQKSSGGGKNATTRPLKGPGTDPLLSAMIGGVSNSPSSTKATKSSTTYSKGGAVRRSK